MNIRLLDFKPLSSYPSGSGIEFFDDKVYLIGDDASSIVVKSKKWKLEKKIHLFQPHSSRIPKLVKSDLEATTIVYVDKKPKLLMLGSGSREQYRNKAILLDLITSETEEFDLHFFYNRLRQEGIEDLNIEGAATVDDKVILSNKGNDSNPKHCIIVTSNEFWRKQDEAEIQILKLHFNNDKESYEGISGMTYSEKNDWIIFTTTAKDNINDFDDGEAGDSYLGVIENVARKIGRKKLKVNDMINLTKAEKKFKYNKIQSVCIQRDKERNLKLHLVADTPDGKSSLYKVRLKD